MREVPLRGRVNPRNFLLLHNGSASGSNPEGQGSNPWGRTKLID